MKFECALKTQVMTDAFVDSFNRTVRYVSLRSDLVVVYNRPFVPVTNVEDDVDKAFKG